MTGTFGGALEARGIPAGDGYLHPESTGELEIEIGTLVIKRVHVRYFLNVTASLLVEKRDAIQRAFDLHHDSCPVYKSIHKCVDITKELDLIQKN